MQCCCYWWALCWAQADAFLPLSLPFSCPLLVQVAGHPSGVCWEPGGLLLCTSGSDCKGHFGGWHRGSFCLLRSQCESLKAFSYSGTGLSLGALGWWQDAAHPLGSGYRAREAHIHPSVSGILAAREEYGPAVDQRCCSEVLRAGERWAVSRQWSIRGQARYARAQDDSMS